MKKEFVPYGLAIKLKEIGFEEPCFGGFDDGYLHIRRVDFQSDIKGFSLAPTYSQAFRWFREKYNLICRVDVTSYGCTLDEQEFYCEITSKNGNASYEIFNTYEEAELDCLKKLIELTFKSE